MTKTYLLYDGRAVGGDTDEAVVLTCSLTLKEARHDAKTCGFGECVIYEYDVTPEGELINEQFVEVIQG